MWVSGLIPVMSNSTSGLARPEAKNHWSLIAKSSLSSRPKKKTGVA